MRDYYHIRLLKTDTTGCKFERLGTGYGGWWVPREIIVSGTVAVCVGAGEDVSFDISLARLHEMTVHIVDPTPRAKRHVLAILEALSSKQSVCINNSAEQYYDLTGLASTRLRYVEKGFWSENGRMRFYAPREPSYVSHSITNLKITNEFFEADCVTPKQFCENEGIHHIEILKLDIEGAECAVLESLVGTQIRPTILCVEFDEAYHWRHLRTFRRIGDVIENLRAAGYLLGYIDRWNVTFVHRIALSRAR